ncbi:MAG: hypothetical protein OK442_00665 [Thaumarchaeota archaeon]|nr:hypothetical protein [Nitrososphaerota archaeon]
MNPTPGQTASLPSRRRRLFYAISGIVLVMAIGIVGFHQIEGMDWVNAFYFESMLATGQGPPLALNTNSGKIFASVMGFASFGTVFTSLVVTLVPIISQLWREGLDRAERDAKKVEKDAKALENDLSRRKVKPDE